MTTTTIDQTNAVVDDILDGHDASSRQDQADDFQSVPFDDDTDFTLDPSAFDDLPMTPTHSDAFQPTEADEMAETAYRIGLAGDLASFRVTFPGLDHLMPTFYEGVQLGRQARARRDGFAAGMSWHSHTPTCSDPANPQCVAFCQGVVAGQAQLAADRQEALAEMDAEADAIEWERRMNRHNAEVERWHDSELVEIGSGYRLVRSEAVGLA